MDLFKLIGNDNLLTWVYDNPTLIHAIMTVDPRRPEGALPVHGEGGAPLPEHRHLDALPGQLRVRVGPAAAGQDRADVRLKDCWCWADSQESAPISPAMFEEFFLPSIAEVTRPFGLTYYGCCEALHDRFELVEKAIPNLRAVSVSGWSDLARMGEMLGKKYVYSRKPTPAYISGAHPDWELLKKDVRDTLDAAETAASSSASATSTPSTATGPGWRDGCG